MLNSSSSGFFLPIVSSSTAMIVSRFKSSVFAMTAPSITILTLRTDPTSTAISETGKRICVKPSAVPGFSTSEALVNNMPPGATPWRHCS